jgi:hypothetical protein
MRLIRILFVCGAVAATQVAMADSPSPQALGSVNAILRFCAEVDARDADRFQAWWQQLSGTKTELGDYKGDAAFQQSYNAVRDLLEKSPRQQAALDCASGVSSPKQDVQQKPDKPHSHERD